ncbi:beta-lactamase/transpeptidase-like protein [Kalaharituber pfeilii]|nr:beta-lactamase/transpeptidase-like protein [Kalaharituber pfeilii]
MLAHPNHNEDQGKPLWEYHYTADLFDARGTRHVGRDTVFRVASLSKLVTMVGAVKAGLDLDASIVQYIPQLKREKNKKGMRRWEDVTVRSLGSHLSGVQTGFGYNEITALLVSLGHASEELVNLGFPPLPETEFPSCEFLPSHPQKCSTDELLKILSSESPAVPPFSQPIYSNPSFALLALAIESATSMSFEKFMQEHVFHSLGMYATTFSFPGNDSVGSIPPTPNLWGIDFGTLTPGGGLYSTTSDYTKLLLSLLPSHQNRKPIFEPHPLVATKFLLPSSMVPSTNTLLLGAPWEIFRPASNKGGLTIYTKAGGIQGYTTMAAIIPEYDLALTVFVSGDPVADVIFDTIIGHLDDGKEKGILVGGFGEVAKRETKRDYDGEYAAPPSSLNSSMTLVTDMDGRTGIRVQSWISNGTDFANLAIFLGISGSAQDIEARLYPVDLFGTISKVSLKTGYEGTQVKVRKEVWSMVVVRKNSVTSPLERVHSTQTGIWRGPRDDACFTFAEVENTGKHGGESISRILVWREEIGRDSKKQGEVLGIEIPALRVFLAKK